MFGMLCLVTPAGSVCDSDSKPSAFCPVLSLAATVFVPTIHFAHEAKGRSNPMKLFIFAAVFSLAALGSALQAQVIISDTFDGGLDGASIEGRIPTINLPGAVWARATSQISFMTTLSGGFGNPLPGAFGNFQSGSGISIASSGAYVKPTQLTISADLSPKDLIGTADQFRGLALGFYSQTGAAQQFSQALFTGLVLDAAGSLSLVNDPFTTGFNGPGTTASPAIAFVGLWDPNAFHMLSYRVNTVTGRVSNISLGGSFADYTPLSVYTFFTDAATNFAGMYTSSGFANGLGAVDNFTVAVPEPGAMALGLAGSIGVLGIRRRRA